MSILRSKACILPSGVGSNLYVRGPFLGSAPTLYDGPPKSLCTGGSLVEFYTILLLYYCLHRDQLRAQRSLTSMGSLYLFTDLNISI